LEGTRDIDRFDGTSWTRETTADAVLNAPAAAIVNDEILVIGGFTGTGNVPTARVRGYNLTSKTWRDLPALPTARGGMQAVVLNGKVHVIGGGNNLTTLSAHEVFDHTSAGYEKEVVAKTGGAGVDLVIEMLANVNLMRDLEMIAKRGRVVIVGNRGSIEINARAIMSKDAVVTGLTNWNATPKEMATAHAAIIAGMERSGYKPEVGKEMPLGDAPRAHEEVMKPGAYGKIVLIP